MKRTLLCTATRWSRDDFWKHSLLGQSLLRFPKALLPDLAIRFDNQGERKQGLSTVYNRALDRCLVSQHLLCVHDDVYLHDPFVQHRIDEGLQRYDVIGLAGSSHSDPRQPSWGLAFDDELRCLGWQNGGGRSSHVLLSGAVSHTSQHGRWVVGASEAPPFVLSEYGSLPAECHLLDGLFLALDVLRVKNAGVQFDDQFAFHHYDLDLCRTARSRGLTLGTWPVAVTHGSPGDFSSLAWKTSARAYLNKWCPRVPLHMPLPIPSSRAFDDPELDLHLGTSP